MGNLAHVNLKLVTCVEDAMEFKRWLGQSRQVLGVDTETGGFHHWRDELRLCQFGDLDTGWAIPWKRWGGVAIEALNSYEAPMVLHNAPFDSRFIIHHAGKDLRRWKWEWVNDTMTMGHLLDPLRPKGLKPLGAMYVDPSAAAAQKMLDEAMATNKWDWDTVPVDFPLYWIYGAMDPVITCHLYKKFEQEVTGAYKSAYDLELNTIRIVTNMMLKGARVDLDYCHTTQRKLMTWVGEARQWLAKEYGLANATSGPQLGACLKKHGVELMPKLTKGGEQSYDKEVLAEAAHRTQHPILQYVLMIRKCEKNVGPYFKNFIELANDDLLHPTIWPMGTRTARMSITDPALQTLPRKDPTVRNAFVPRDGNTLVTSDYDQIEARLCAHFAHDTGMIDAFAGEDFFYALASQIFSKPVSDVTKEERQYTKNTTYGKLYGAGPEKMAQTAGVPLETMLAVVNAFDQRFPGVKQLQRAINHTALQRKDAEGVAYINTPYGRKLIADDDKEYTLTNYLIQSHAAEILKVALARLDAVGLGEYMVLPVHDEVVFDVPTDLVHDVLPSIKDCMQNLTDYRVPITASPEVINGAWGVKYQ